MERKIKKFIDKGMQEGLDKNDYIELKNIALSTTNDKTLLEIKCLLSLIYNNGVLNKMSDENVNYILSNSYLLPLVLTNSKQDKIKVTSKDSYMFDCPFHDDEKNKFSVTDHLNYGHCFKCNTNVSNVSYLKKIEGINYIDAIDLLAYIYMIDIKHENRKILPLVSKYQDTIKSDKYARLLEAGLLHEMKKYGLSSEILNRYNVRFKTIERIKNNEYDSNFILDNENKKLVLTNEILKNTILK